MPIHDWTRASDAALHDFQLSWATRLATRLNSGALPPTHTGSVENVAVGDALPDVPIFLTEERYVPCPLEATYAQSWAVFPQALKAPLETPPSRPAK